ncbi:50S ribosomal protein L10 [bacterium]|nr:50S ribosomal protein L10 [bacterium]
MPNKKNIQQVEELTKKLDRAKAIYFTDYLGLDVGSITQLRSEFFRNSIEYYVAKNTLIKIAAENNKIEGLNDFLSGPTAMAISYDEPTTPAKIIKEFAKKFEKPTVKGMLFNGAVLDGSKFNSIADMPSREQLIATFAALLQSPLVKLAIVLNATMSNLVGVLNNLKEKKS